MGSQELTSLGSRLHSAGDGQTLRTCGLRRMPDYDLPALKNSNLGYILSGIVGTIVIGIVAWLFTMLVTMRKSEPKPK